MENDPKHYDLQTWAGIGPWFICRTFDKWEISLCSGIYIPISPELGKQLAEHLERVHREEAEKDRRSLSFKWLRFRYRLVRKLGLDGFKKS